MKILIAEDDFVSRKLLLKILRPYGQCDVAVDGAEAILAFKMAWSEGTPYDLILLDIMMPKYDGHHVLKEIRRIETDKGIQGLDGAKVIMTTALDDARNIIEAFRSQCEAYLTKPIDRDRVINQLVSLDLIASEPH